MIPSPLLYVRIYVYKTGIADVAEPWRMPNRITNVIKYSAVSTYKHSLKHISGKRTMSQMANKKKRTFHSLNFILLIYQI